MNLYEFTIAYVLCIIITFCVMAIMRKLQLRHIDNTTDKYYTHDINYKRVPIEFMFKNHKIIITTKEDTMELSTVSYFPRLTKKTFYFNDNVVACLISIEGSGFFTKRYLEFDSKYETKYFYKILRSGRKAYNKMWLTKFKEEQKQQKLSMY
jgi:hypothetical protein